MENYLPISLLLIVGEILKKISLELPLDQRLSNSKQSSCRPADSCVNNHRAQEIFEVFHYNLFLEVK